MFAQLVQRCMTEDIPWYKWMDSEQVVQIASRIAREREINKQLLTTTSPRKIPDKDIPDIRISFDWSRTELVAMYTLVFIQNIITILKTGSAPEEPDVSPANTSDSHF